MVENGHIVKVEQPTEWVRSMAAVLRNDIICINQRDLNKVIKREHHPLCAIEGVVAGMPDSKVFSVLVAKSGFLQIKLDEESSTLTTFNTPIQ